MNRFLQFAILAPLLALAAPVAVSAAEEQKPPTPELHKVHLVGRHRFYDVDVSYPRFSGLSDDANAALNQAVKHLVNTNIPARPGTAGMRNSFTASYHVSFCSPRVVSIDFEFYDYFGGAHGLTRHVPFNYAIAPRLEKLTLRSIVGKRTGYWRLTHLCDEQMRKDYKNVTRFDDSPITPDMLTVFTISKRGLTFTFPESELFPHSTGCPEVVLTMKQLGRAVSPDSILRNL